MKKEIIIAMNNAVKNGKLDRVQELLAEHEWLIEERTVFGTWLHEAVTWRQIPIVKFLIDYGMDVNAKAGMIFEGNALRSAVSEGDLNLVKLLYAHGAELDVSEPEGNPLFGAISGGHVKIAKFLIDAGIDLTASYPVGSLEECDAYEWARQWGQTEIKDYIKAKLDEQGHGDSIKEAVYLIETEDGKTVRVPESELDAWEKVHGTPEDQ